MIVIRFTWHYQEANFEKARKMFSEVKMPEPSLLRGARGYESVTGTANTLALEWEFDSLSDWEKFSEQFFALPGNVELFRDHPEAHIQTTEVWSKIA
jgi:hypothetical protein